MEKEKKGKERASVKLSPAILGVLKTEQYKEWAETKKQPTYLELLERAWAAYERERTGLTAELKRLPENLGSSENKHVDERTTTSDNYSLTLNEIRAMMTEFNVQPDVLPHVLSVVHSLCVVAMEGRGQSERSDLVHAATVERHGVDEDEAEALADEDLPVEDKPKVSQAVRAKRKNTA